MSTEAKISVIIPSYNHAHYIREAIESALAQTYETIEIIVIDDGSTDNTKEVLAPYVRDQKIHYIYHKNRGLSAARNTGLKAAQGRYIKFLDSDDFLYPEQIERQVDQIGTSDNLISISDFCFLRPNGEVFNLTYCPVNEERQLNTFFEGNPAPVHAFLVPKTLIQEAGSFDETFTACEDWDLWIRILQEGAVIKHLPYTGCCYRISTTSMSANPKKMFIQKCKIIEKINTWLFREENFAQRMSKDYWFDSIAKINTKLIDEGMARRIPFKSVPQNVVHMMDLIFNQQLKGVFKLALKTIGTKNYLRLKYQIKILLKKNYKFDLVHGDRIWKLGEVSEISKN